MAYPRREIEIIPENIPLNIVYEDDELLVVNKPAGMVVHPSYGHYTGTLVNALAWHLKGNPLFKDNHDPRPGLVHRIDKDTSGLLVIAKTEKAKVHLASQFFHKTSDRKYVAVCWGNLESENGTVIGHIGRNLTNRKLMHCFPDGSYGKHAVTHYECLDSYPKAPASYVKCVLETGRTHQIRVHLSSLGHSLIGDSVYGVVPKMADTRLRFFERQALHAGFLSFVHPKTGERLSFEAPMPQDMQDLKHLLENEFIVK